MLGVLRSLQIKLRLILELNDLTTLADNNMVRLMSVSGHEGNGGNEKADGLARDIRAKPFLEPEPALGIPKSETKIIRGNSTWNAGNYWHGKLFIDALDDPYKKNRRNP